MTTNEQTVDPEVVGRLRFLQGAYGARGDDYGFAVEADLVAALDALQALQTRVGELEADAEFWCGLLGEAQDALDHLGSGDYWVGEWFHDEMVPTWKGAQPVMETAEAYGEEIRRKIKARAPLTHPVEPRQ